MASDACLRELHSSYQPKLDRSGGQCSIPDSGGAIVASAFGPHTGRVLTINELGKKREGEKTHWRGELLTEVSQLKTGAQKTPGGAIVTVSGVYPRPGVPREAVEGKYRMLVQEPEVNRPALSP